MKYFFLALSVFVLFAACSKNSTPTSSTVDILTTGKWHITSGTLAERKPNGVDTILNYLNWIPYCHKDDYIKFVTATQGYSYPGSILCNPSDDSTSFTWYLTSGNSVMSITGFNFNYAALDSVVGRYYFDTVSKPPATPIVVLDTLVGAAAAAAAGTPIVLDTTWNLKFDTISAASLTQYSTVVPSISTYNAVITNLTSSSFTLNYALYAFYPDSTNHHTGPPADPYPIIRLDTFHYSVTYSSF